LKPYPAPGQALLGGQAISPAIESTRLSPEAASGQAVVENAILGSMTMSRPGGSSPEGRGLAWPEWQAPDKVREGELVLRRRTGVQSEARLSEQDEHAPDGPDLSLAQTQPAAVRLSLANPPTPALSEAKVQREATDVSDVPEEQMHEGEPESPTLPGVTAAPDIKELARQVYPLIKRMLANERERAFGRRG